MIDYTVNDTQKTLKNHKEHVRTYSKLEDVRMTYDRYQKEQSLAVQNGERLFLLSSGTENLKIS